MRCHQPNKIGNIGYSADENTILHRGVPAQVPQKRETEPGHNLDLCLVTFPPCHSDAGTTLLIGHNSSQLTPKATCVCETSKDRQTDGEWLVRRPHQLSNSLPPSRCCCAWYDLLDIDWLQSQGLKLPYSCFLRKPILSLTLI